MSRYKWLLTSTVILFLCINTAYYWEGKLEFWAMLLYLVYLIVFVVLSVYLIVYIFLTIKERFRDKGRLYITLIMALVLTAVSVKPRGLIDFESFESKDVFAGWQE